MSKFNLKSLFVKSKNPISSDADSDLHMPEESTDIESSSASLHVQSSDVSPDQQVVDDLLDRYQSELEKENLEGFDFYELFGMIVDAGATPNAYKMAFKMGKSLNEDLSITSLNDQAQHYIDKMLAVKQSTDATGKLKLQKLDQSKKQEKQQLENSIKIDEKQLEDLQKKLNESRRKLADVDGSFTDQVNKVKSTLTANEIAGENIVDKLTIVKNGLLQHIK